MDRVHRKLERIGPKPICPLKSQPISAKIQFRRQKQTNGSLSRNCGMDSDGSDYINKACKQVEP